MFDTAQQNRTLQVGRTSEFPLMRRTAAVRAAVQRFSALGSRFGRTVNSVFSALASAPVAFLVLLNLSDLTITLPTMLKYPAPRIMY